MADDRKELQQKAVELLSSAPSALLGFICLLI
jgi:hypothetical protein